MLELIKRIDKPDRVRADCYSFISLPIEMRVRSRLRAQMANGEEAGLFLERGILLRGGDILQSKDGKLVEIRAAAETVSTVYCDDALMLAKAAYHLGNRHVPLQVEPGWLRYQHDHVLDEMLQLMGLDVQVEQAPFEPEAGAYQQMGAHSHGHSHNQGHAHGHSHSNEHLHVRAPGGSLQHHHSNKPSNKIVELWKAK